MKPFDDSNFEEFRKKSTGANFEDSYDRVLMSAGTTKFPKFGRGVLPKSEEPADAIKPARDMRRSMGYALWLKGFANNRERFARMFAFAEDPVTKSEPEDGESTPPALSGPPLWTLFANDSDGGCSKPARKRRTRAAKLEKESVKREAAFATELDAPVIPAREVVANESDDTRPPAKRNRRAAKRKCDQSPIEQGNKQRPQEQQQAPPPRAAHVREVAGKEREDSRERGKWL